MDKLKKLGILLAVLAVVCIATIIVSSHEIKKEKIKASDDIVFEVPSDDVAKLSWEHDGSKLSFSKKDGVWQSDDDASLPVDEDKINELLKLFEEFGVSFIIEEPEKLSDYGLDQPECTISFSTSDKDYTVKLGGFSTMDQERYVSIDDGNVYLVKTDPLDAFNKTLDYFTKSDEIPAPETADSIKVSGSAIDTEYSISYDVNNSAAYSDEDVYYCNNEALDSEKVKSYLEAVSEVSLDNCVDHNFSEDKLGEYGLDQPVLSVDISYPKTDDKGKKTGETGEYSFSIGIDPKDKDKFDAQGKLLEDSSEDTADATSDADSDKESSASTYIRFNDSKLVYKLSDEDYKTLTAAKLGDFVKSELIPSGFDKAESIDFELDGNTYTFTGNKKLVGGTDWSYNGSTVDISNIQSAIEAVKANAVTDETPTLKKELSIHLKSSDSSHPDETLDIYRYNGSDCILVSPDKSSKLVSRKSVVALCEAVYSIVLG